MPWQPRDPLVLLTRPIENLQELLELAGLPYLDMQLLQKGSSMMRNTREFECALSMWEDLSETCNKWENSTHNFTKLNSI